MPCASSWVRRVLKLRPCGRTAKFAHVTFTHVAAAVSVAAALGLLLAGLLGADGVGRHERLKAELERVQQINSALKVENARLAAERRALRHDPAYIDRVIWDDLGYIRDDQVVLELGSPMVTDRGSAPGEPRPAAR